MQTRTKILDSATRTFLRRGLSCSSLSDIASDAGVTRGAVYGHFKNKSELFDAIFEYAAIPVDPFLIRLPSEQCDPLAHLKLELATLLGKALSDGTDRRLYSVIYSRCEITKETKTFWNRVYAVRKLAEERIAVVLSDAQSNSQLRDGIEVEYLAMHIHSCLMGYFSRSIGDPVHRAPFRVAERIVGLIFFGFLSWEQSTSGTEIGLKPQEGLVRHIGKIV